MTAAQAQLTLDAGQRSADADRRAAKRDQMASCPDRTAFTPARDQWTESAPARGLGAHMMVVAVDVRPPAPAPKGPLARFVDRVLNLGPVRWLIPIIDAYDAAGGGLLASGLAFSSLFAILPSILLIIAVVGVILGDPGRLAAMSASLSVSFPPLAGFFKVAFGGFADGAITYSVIGVVALIWGASRFYQSLDDAMARIFASNRRRDPLERSLLGVLSVLLMAAVVGVVIVASQLTTYLGGSQLPGMALGSDPFASTVGTALASIVLLSAGIAVIYRLVPTNRPSWRAIRRPALVVGTFVAIFTALFTVLTPQLVGSLQIYGAFVAVFAAMIWLSFVCQALLIGAAWVHRRVVLGGLVAQDVDSADDLPISASRRQHPGDLGRNVIDSPAHGRALPGHGRPSNAVGGSPVADLLRRRVPATAHASAATRGGQDPTKEHE